MVTYGIYLVTESDSIPTESYAGLLAFAIRRSRGSAPCGPIIITITGLECDQGRNLGMIVYHMQPWVLLNNLCVFGIHIEMDILGPVGQESVDHPAGIAVISALIECCHN
jgi:hypothetical protein